MDEFGFPGGKQVAVVHDNDANRIVCSKRTKQVKEFSYQQENDELGLNIGVEAVASWGHINGHITVCSHQKLSNRDSLIDRTLIMIGRFYSYYA